MCTHKLMTFGHPLTHAHPCAHERAWPLCGHSCARMRRTASCSCSRRSAVPTAPFGGVRRKGGAVPPWGTADDRRSSAHARGHPCYAAEIRAPARSPMAICAPWAPVPVRSLPRVPRRAHRRLTAPAKGRPRPACDRTSHGHHRRWTAVRTGRDRIASLRVFTPSPQMWITPARSKIFSK